jgi:mRNA-degrading endonuclease RelE of RelBE toxin-antitoxin system
MNTCSVIWLPSVRTNLIQFRSERFTSDETFDFISQFVLEVEDYLMNPVFGKAYTEEFGDYRGMIRIVVRKFRVYYEQVDDELTIVAVLFPGEK